MKALFSFVIGVLMMLVFQYVQADGNFYIGVQGGVNFLDSRYLTKRHFILDTGCEAGVIGGYEWRSELSLEGEITCRANDYRLHGTDGNGGKATFHGHIHLWSFMVNSYGQLPISLWECISPFVGVGVGADQVHQRVKIEGRDYKGSNTGFSWQLMGGLKHSFCEDMVVTIEYQFHKSPLRYGQKQQNQSVVIGFKKLFCSF